MNRTLFTLMLIAVIIGVMTAFLAFNQERIEDILVSIRLFLDF